MTISVDKVTTLLGHGFAIKNHQQFKDAMATALETHQPAGDSALDNLDYGLEQITLLSLSDLDIDGFNNLKQLKADKNVFDASDLSALAALNNGGSPDNIDITEVAKLQIQGLI